MDERQGRSLSLHLLGLAVIAGLLGSMLLDKAPFGIGFPLFFVALCGLTVVARRVSPAKPKGETMALLFACLPFAAFFAVREADGVRMLNGLMILLLVGLFTARSRQGSAFLASITDVLVRAPIHWMGFIIDGIQLAAEVRWKDTFDRQKLSKVLAVGSGLLIATPLVLVFTTLLARADSVFADFLARSFSFDATWLLEHVSVGLLVTILTGGMLRHSFGVLTPPPIRMEPEGKGDNWTLGTTEVSTVLVVLNVLFAAFVGIQFRYFFGGSALVLTTSDLSYAEYARQGFFELLAVVGLALPMLVGLHSVLRKDGPRSEGFFKVLGTALTALLVVVAVSALHRMRLYVDYYSLSPLRLYATAGMVFLAAVLLWFAGTLLSGKMNRFAIGATAILGLVVLGLNFLNPDATIAQFNIKARPGQRIDGYTLASLSGDAVPVLNGHFDSLPPRARHAIATEWVDRLRRRGDWATWNWSTERATTLIRSRENELRQVLVTDDPFALQD